MRAIKICFFLLAFSVFLFGKQSGAVRTNKLDWPVKKNSFQSVAESVSGNSQDEAPFSKRRYKSKGVEVDNAHIQNLLPERIASYRDYTPIFLEHAFTSFLYCTEHKRGPPVI